MKKNIKILALSLCLLCGIVEAADQLAPPTESESDSMDTMGLYVEAMGGFGFRNMQQDSVLSAEVSYQNISLSPDISTHWSNGEYSWVAGLNAAYMLTPIFSMESGFLKLGSQRFHINSGNGVDTTTSFCIDSTHCFKSGSHINFSSWFAYGGVRGDWAIVKNWSAFMRVALAYVSTDIKIHRIDSSDVIANDDASSTHWAPVLALGVNYAFAQRWRVSLAYWVLLSQSHLGQDHLFTHRDFSTFDQIDMPVWQALMMSVGYRFSL